MRVIVFETCWEFIGGLKQYKDLDIDKYMSIQSVGSFWTVSNNAAVVNSAAKSI